MCGACPSENLKEVRRRSRVACLVCAGSPSEVVSLGTGASHPFFTVGHISVPAADWLAHGLPTFFCFCRELGPHTAFEDFLVGLMFFLF